MAKIPPPKSKLPKNTTESTDSAASRKSASQQVDTKEIQKLQKAFAESGSNLSANIRGLSAEIRGLKDAIGQQIKASDALFRSLKGDGVGGRRAGHKDPFGSFGGGLSGAFGGSFGGGFGGGFGGSRYQPYDEPAKRDNKSFGQKYFTMEGLFGSSAEGPIEQQGSFIGRSIARRIREKRYIKDQRKMGRTDTADIRADFREKEDIAKQQRENQQAIDELTDRGWTEAKLAKTPGYKDLISQKRKLEKSRAKLDPTYQRESKQADYAPATDMVGAAAVGAGLAGGSIESSESSDETLELMHEQNELLKEMVENTKPLIDVAKVLGAGGIITGSKAVADAAAAAPASSGMGLGDVAKMAAPAAAGGIGLGTLALAAGGVAVGGGLLYAGSKLAKGGYHKTSVAADAAGGAAIGAAIGSVVPVLGTGVGAAVGGIAGGAYGLYQNYFSGDAEQEAVSPDGKTVTRHKRVERHKKGIKIAGEWYEPGKPLSDNQLAAIGVAKQMGNSYPADIEQQYAKQMAEKNKPASSTAPTSGSGRPKMSAADRDRRKADKALIAAYKAQHGDALGDVSDAEILKHAKYDERQAQHKDGRMRSAMISADRVASRAEADWYAEHGKKRRHRSNLVQNAPTTSADQTAPTTSADGWYPGKGRSLGAYYEKQEKQKHEKWLREHPAEAQAGRPTAGQQLDTASKAAAGQAAAPAPSNNIVNAPTVNNNSTTVTSSKAPARNTDSSYQAYAFNSRFGDF